MSLVVSSVVAVGEDGGVSCKFGGAIQLTNTVKEQIKTVVIIPIFFISEIIVVPSRRNVNLRTKSKKS